MKLLFRIIAIFVGLSAIFIYIHQLFDISSITALSQLSTLLNKTTRTPFEESTTTTKEENNQQQPHLKLQTDADDNKHLFATDMSVPRAIRKVFLAIEQAEGAGARVRRSIGTPQLRNFSPFLMLDHFSIKPGAGFPDQYVFPVLCGKSWSFATECVVYKVWLTW